MHDAFVALSVANDILVQVFCMSGPLHGIATKSFDERYKRKQRESFLSQPEHTIWVPRRRTFRTQYLHLGVFL